jgi:hypothetical protein
MLELYGLSGTRGAQAPLPRHLTIRLTLLVGALFYVFQVIASKQLFVQGALQD